MLTKTLNKKHSTHCETNLCIFKCLGHEIQGMFQNTIVQAGIPGAICEIGAGTGHHFPIIISDGYHMGSTSGVKM